MNFIPHIFVSLLVFHSNLATTQPTFSPSCSNDPSTQFCICFTNKIACKDGIEIYNRTDCFWHIEHGCISITNSPTNSPTINPTMNPTYVPTVDPTMNPSKSPSIHPTSYPTNKPSKNPTNKPSVPPTSAPTFGPTESDKPTIDPTTYPTPIPTQRPIYKPTYAQTLEPTMEPTLHPIIKTTLINGMYTTNNDNEYSSSLNVQTIGINTTIIIKNQLFNSSNDLFNGFELALIVGLIVISTVICCICSFKYLKENRDKYCGTYHNLNKINKQENYGNDGSNKNDDDYEDEDEDEDRVDHFPLNTIIVETN